MSRIPAATVRARVAAVLLSGALLCGAAVPQLAQAAEDDNRDERSTTDEKSATDKQLQAQKKRVEGKMDGAHDDLEHSSAQLRSATTALGGARTQLSQAQAQLAQTRGELAAAEALDQQMQAKLVAARAELARARAELTGSREDIADEEDELGQIVVQHYQGGDPSLMGLSMVLTTQNPAELTGQLNSVRNVMDKEAVVLDRLEVAQAMLEVQEDEVEAAKERVADDREAAAANLLRKQGLEQQAAAAEAAVTERVAAFAEARRAAEEAKAADLAQLDNLEKERERIAAVLKRRADEARRRAAAAARRAGALAAPVLGGGPVRSNGFLDYPVAGQVTSPFGWRTHPIYGYRALHDGVDFGSSCGTPIRATASGTVIERYFQSAWGNRVIIDHGYRKGAGLATISNHLSSYAVSVGDRVSRGDVIGFVGNTGWSTGCHLHFTVLQDGQPVDPLSWM